MDFETYALLKNHINKLSFNEKAEVPSTQQDKGKVVTVNSEGDKILEYPSAISYKYAYKMQETESAVLFCVNVGETEPCTYFIPSETKITTLRIYKNGEVVEGSQLATQTPYDRFRVVECNETRVYLILSNSKSYTASYFYYFSKGKWEIKVEQYPLTELENMFIGFDNEKEFTPESDYQPATKKYVDDECRKLSEEISNLKENGTDAEDGIGIESVVQTTTSSEDGGINIITVTKTDGTPTTFQVRNGSKGSPGEKGATGKTAYEYAQDGGYTETEKEFAEKLAQKNPTEEEFNDIKKQKVDKINTALYITPEMYGAVGDGETDDSSAIQQAINEAGSMKVVYLADKTYKIDTGLKIASNYAIFKCDGWLNYSGEDAAVTLSNMYRGIVEIETITATNGTAIKLDATEGAVYSNNVKVNFIRASKIGICLYTNNTHISHNTIANTYIASTEIGIKVWADNGSNAYINENRFYLDWIDGGCQYGIHLHSDEALNNLNGYGVNDNRFFSGSLEGMASDGVAIYLDRTYGNYFESIRCAEGYGKYSVKFNGKCIRNIIGLTHLVLSEIDITDLASGSVHNILKCPGIITENTNYYIAGDEARVNYANGISYVPDKYNHEVSVTEETFTDNIIDKIGTVLPTSLTFRTESVNGSTFTMGGIFSNADSMTRGFPLTMRLKSAGGQILLKDIDGNTILDNTNGDYDEKVLSVCWAGYHKGQTKNFWDVQIFGEVPLYEPDLDEAIKGILATAKESGEFDGQDGSDGVSCTHSWNGTILTVTSASGTTSVDLKGEKGDKGSDGSDASVTATNIKTALGYTPASESKAETWNFTLSDGSTVTKKVVLA